MRRARKWRPTGSTGCCNSASCRSQSQREVQGQRGVVQGRPDKWVTQADVQQQSLRGGGWCAIEPQFQLVYAFDTLIGNEGRTPDRCCSTPQDWIVYAPAMSALSARRRACPRT